MAKTKKRAQGGRTVREPARRLPVIAEADVVVAGGGPGGFPAAIAASRAGAKVLLLEHHGFLGGMMTAGLVGPILGVTANKSSKAVVGGLVRELHKRLKHHGSTVPWAQCLRGGCIPFDAETTKYVLDEWVTAEKRLELMFHTYVVAVVKDGSRVTSAIVETKSGRAAIRGKVFVDATGDGDLAFFAGAKTTHGRSIDGKAMAMGSMFHVGGVTPVRDKKRYEKARKAVAAQVRRQGVPLYGLGMGGKGSVRRNGETSVNATRAAGSSVDVFDLTRAELSTRADAWKMVEAYRRHFPEWHDAHITRFPAHAGIRESRQAVGDYVLTGDDVIAGRKFDDSIAACGYWIDIHCPLGRAGDGVHLCNKGCPSERPCPMFRNKRKGLRTFEGLWPAKGSWFGIPYRALTPVGLDNVLVSGRAISGDNEAMGTFRIMATCMAVGEAAGTAARIALKTGGKVRKVDVGRLRGKLKRAGAFIG